ncbi:MAG: ATP synthase F1 subunit epsilon [Alphaproteobacteria bacterium]|nr:ATP synthase F1 subunit epsilon [Alphaproteobacteria bacterium]
MHLTLISPEKIVFSGAVEMAVIPGAKGEFGVLENHIPFMTMLSQGAVRLYDGNTLKQDFTISGGFCEVTPDGCVIVADTVEKT